MNIKYSLKIFALKRCLKHAIDVKEKKIEFGKDDNDESSDSLEFVFV